MSPDPYYKQTISFSFHKQNYLFHVSQELFSSHTVDRGTQRLLRTFLYSSIPAPKKILDLGCGYGPLGIVLKNQFPDASVHFVDRDALALEYARQNTMLNKCEKSTSFYASLGYDSVRESDFDLIVSNIPAKVGEKVLEHFILDAHHRLVPKGTVAIVVVDAINEATKRILKENENIEMLYEQSWPGHHVYHYTFRSLTQAGVNSAFQTGMYERSLQSFRWKQETLELITTYHLKEFDQLGFDTRLLLKNLHQLSSLSSVVVINPGQGYIPVVVTRQTMPQKLILIDRDLQALEVSQENLIRHDYSKDHIFVKHQVGWDVESTDVSAIVGILPEKQKLEVYSLFLDQAWKMLEQEGKLLLCSTSTTMSRLEEVNKKQKRFTVASKEKSKGMGCILFRKS